MTNSKSSPSLAKKTRSNAIYALDAAILDDEKFIKATKAQCKNFSCICATKDAAVITNKARFSLVLYTF